MPKPKANIKLRIKAARAGTFQWVKIAWLKFKMKLNRRTFANLFMLCFIILTSVGAGMIYFPAGWVVAGVTCGLFGYLLGAE